MKNMCDFCGGDSRVLYPYDPVGKIYVCDKYQTRRDIAFMVKNKTYSKVFNTTAY